MVTLPYPSGVGDAESSPIRDEPATGSSLIGEDFSLRFIETAGSKGDWLSPTGLPFLQL